MKKVLSFIVVAGMLLGVGTTMSFAIGGASGPVGYKAVGKLGAIHMNPYNVAPLTAVIMNGGYDVTDVNVVVKGKKDGGIDIKYSPSDNAVRLHGGIPVWGLYPEYQNTVEVSYKRNGEAVSETYKIYGPAIYMRGPGAGQLSILPKAEVIKMDSKFGSSGKCRDKRFQLSEQAGRSDASRMGPVWFVGDATAKSGIEKSSPRQYISCWFPNQSTKGDWPWRRQVICTTLWG